MVANRQLYGLEKPQRQLRAKLEMPFKAERRHQYWSADIRSIEEHLLPDPKPVYVITEVKNARRIETHFRSPQLDLWRLSDTEWLLALRRPEPIAPNSGKIVPLAQQLVLPEFGATG